MAAPVQIVWSFDTTGSMSSCLESVKSQIQDLSERLLRDIPTLEIGLIAHGDYCDRHSSYLIKTMPFSSDPKEIKNWVKDVGSTGGGDAPEAYEIALRSAARDFAWKENARKVVTIIGDEVPHEASFHDNTDNVDWNAELACLAEQGIRCFGVQCLNNHHSSHFYRALAERTDGLWLPMQDLRIIKDVFVAVCLQVADTKAFDQFYSQLAAAGPVATALVPLMTRLAKKKKLSNEELAALCGIVGKLASEHGQPPKEVFLPIDQVEVLATVEAGVAEVTLEQTFTNKKGLAGGVTSFEYRFALPASAAVFHFEAHLSSGRVVKGVVKAKEEARQEYQRAISRGDKAFLMEEKSSDMFSMEVGNLEPEETVKILLKYVTEPEEIDGKTLRLRLPQHVAPKAGGRAVNGMLTCYPIAVTVKTTPSSRVSTLKSLTHSERFEVHRDASANIAGLLKLTPEDGLLHEDLIFDMDVEDSTEPFCVRCEHDEQSGSTIVQVAVRPPAPERKQLESMKLALVLDGSCSMQGPSFELAKEAAARILNKLSLACPGALCSCFLMQHKVTNICDDQPVAEAKTAIEQWRGRCGGGTDFIAAMDVAQSMTRNADAILFVSDGHGPENLQEFFGKVCSHGAATRLFCLGVGPDPGLELLKGLADITGGVCEVVPLQSQIECTAQRLVSALEAKPVDVNVALTHSAKCEQWPAKALAYPGRYTVVYARAPISNADSEMPVEVKINGGVVSIPACQKSKGRNLHRLGARKRLSELERLNGNGGSNESIRELALEYGLTSSQTSFVAIDEKANEAAKSAAKDLIDDLSAASPPGCPSELADDESLCVDSHVDSILRMPFASSARACRRSASSGSLEAAMACMSESMSEVLTRGESLEYLSSRSKCLGASSTAFYRKANKSMGARAVDSMSAIAGGAAARLKSFWAKKPEEARRSETSTSKLSKVLLGRARCFRGVVQHEAFGAEEVAVQLMLEALDGCNYIGRWAAMGQVEAVVVTFDAASGAITIRDQPKNLTILRGSLCEETGSISGEVFQDGVGGGSFNLQPDNASEVEITDTDGDQLAFVRLPGGGVAEYCNGEVVVASVKTLRMHKHSGLCDDGSGSFTIPLEGRATKLDELEHLLRQEGVAIVP